MPRVAVPVTTSSRAGATLPAETTGDATNNHSVANDGAVRLLVRNANGTGTARNVTFKYNRTVDGQAVADRVVSVADATTVMFGPFPVSDFSSTLLVDVAHADLKLRAIE